MKTRSSTVNRAALWIAGCGLLAIFAVTSAPAQVVDIATSPLFSGAVAAPNIVVTPSLEFPTAGQAYIAVNYDRTQTFVGYFNPTKCYSYVGIPSIGVVPDTPGYFQVAVNADANHECSPSATYFSGNFMNWATMGSLDEFRYALTGGNRISLTGLANSYGNGYSETAPFGGTILERAYMPGCKPTYFGGDYCWNSSYTNNELPGSGVADFYGQVNLFNPLVIKNGSVYWYNTPAVGTGATSPPSSANGGTSTSFGNMNAVLGFNPVGSTVIIHNCTTYVYFGSKGYNQSNCNQPDKANGSYQIRVNVCDTNEATTRTDLCLQYPGGGYKPVGQAQINAATMRFAMFGYLHDMGTSKPASSSNYTVPAGCADEARYGATLWNRCRVGGALRSPMKYLGPTTYNAQGVASTNTHSEINVDGSFVRDPDGTAASYGGQYSGFINYLNKFGSAVQAFPQNAAPNNGQGEYKRYDTMGEMFYEAIRYYQGKQPTPQTITSIPNDEAAGFFPVVTTWTDPLIAACSANYIISIADTDTWDDEYIPGYAGSPTSLFRSARPADPTVGTFVGLDAYAWTKKIGVLETTTNSGSPTHLLANLTDFRPIMYMQPNNGTTSMQTATGSGSQAATTIQDTGTGSQGNAAYLVAGAAYWANTNDIRSDVPGARIKTISVDTGGQTRPIWDRQLYLMGKYGGFNNTKDQASDTSANPFFATDPTNPNGPAIRSNSEWADATGVPTNYLFANSPQKLITGLQAAFASITNDSGTAAGGSVTSANLTYGTSDAYVASFSAARWSGTVFDKTITTTGTGITVSATNKWDAGALLTARCGATGATVTTCQDTSAAVTNRNIITTIRTTTGSIRTGKTFTYANLALDNTYLLAMDPTGTVGVPDALGQKRLNYLRGYRGDEASGLFRTRDSVMGDVVNSAPLYEGPPTSGITDADYQTFFNTNVGRTAAVYVGANDGMLHAFDALAGTELFAYIPNFDAPYLADLSAIGYSHETYVDAPLTVAEARVSTVWKTVLVAGVGAGAQGVFALDVTTPNAFGAGNVLFEFSDADDADFGNVLSAPIIVKLQTSATGLPVTYGYFAAITGYNNERTTVFGKADSHIVNDPANRGVLFLLSLDHTLGSVWTANSPSGYYKFYYPAASTTTRNGLGPVQALKSATGDGTVAALYFGDLQGDLWKLKTVGAPSTWIATTTPLFVATDASLNRQPITARPELAGGPFGTTVVAFGTGAYLGTTDTQTPYAQQSEYSIIDDNTGTAVTRANLQQRTATITGTGTAATVAISGTPFTYSGSGSRKGWYLDFPASTTSGERSVNKAAINAGFVTFDTLTLAANVCVPGSGFIYQLNALTGLPLAGTVGGYASTVGIPGPPVIVELGTAAGQTRQTGEQINLNTYSTLVSGTAGKIDAVGTPPAIKAAPVGRVTWREVTNYNDRH